MKRPHINIMYKSDLGNESYYLIEIKYKKVIECNKDSLRVKYRYLLIVKLKPIKS